MVTKTRHYPPSQIRYQVEHPPVTVHLSRKLKDALDAVKGNRSYGQFVLNILQDKLDVELEIKKTPVTQLIAKYINGFSEAMERYGITGKCKKCGYEYFPLWKDGKCDKCHGLKWGEPKLNKFKEKEVTIDPDDYDRVGRVSILDPEKVAYNAGREAGKDEGYDEGYEEALKEYEITYPCSKCGKEITVSPNSKSHRAIIQYLDEHGWGHSKCVG